MSNIVKLMSRMAATIKEDIRINRSMKMSTEDIPQKYWSGIRQHRINLNETTINTINYSTAPAVIKTIL